MNISVLYYPSISHQTRDINLSCTVGRADELVNALALACAGGAVRGLVSAGEEAHTQDQVYDLAQTCYEESRAQIGICSAADLRRRCLAEAKTLDGLGARALAQWFDAKAHSFEAV